jgi:hypothetical protein
VLTQKFFQYQVCPTNKDPQNTSKAPSALSLKNSQDPLRTLSKFFLICLSFPHFQQHLRILIFISVTTETFWSRPVKSPKGREESLYWSYIWFDTDSYLSMSLSCQTIMYKERKRIPGTIMDYIKSYGLKWHLAFSV